MKLFTITAFGAGYVLGTRAGREQYEHIVALARKASHALDLGGPQDRLEAYAGRLEEFASRNGNSHGRERIGS